MAADGAVAVAGARRPGGRSSGSGRGKEAWRRRPGGPVAVAGARRRGGRSGGSSRGKEAWR